MHWVEFKLFAIDCINLTALTALNRPIPHSINFWIRKIYWHSWKEHPRFSKKVSRKIGLLMIRKITRSCTYGNFMHWLYNSPMFMLLHTTIQSIQIASNLNLKGSDFFLMHPVELPLCEFVECVNCDQTEATSNSEIFFNTLWQVIMIKEDRRRSIIFACATVTRIYFSHSNTFD